ncbi:hypothetical protein BO82DRAFT_354615 [Aspergillus uvarum CBS 121591]|uniref:DUF7707 domain-containing protein n=1 Tax=Aspergillus uvarum CBS 121591 TaxID=1448315 RepID=A0A319CRL4_9EURO|nr:hypothetical protein BO82DRAFT_354615 [Aspergillus uvarum CBS 121591]PYH81383.1 hypothetical protein BO82DRAFT_354615 [Aspergillus uvarum CBS 121591]
MSRQTTLDFSCICSNGSAADVALYAQTVPFFVCQANYAQCISNSSSLTEEEHCKDYEKTCGTLNASAASTTSSTTSSATSLTTATSTSTSSDKSTTATGTSTSSSTSSSSTANAAVRLAQEHATGLLATALFVGLRLVL